MAVSILITVLFISSISSAPTNMDDRDKKALSYFDYIQPDETDYNSYGSENDDYMSMGIEDNDLSRTIPSRKRITNRPYNSPIYYIRLPPQPYMFVPGLGYVSQPPPSPVSQFLNLPVSFVANGKPSTIYQWAAPPPAPPVRVPTPPKQPPKPSDSTIHRIPGKFTFNGKPNDSVYVLRDSYNSLYGDALQNFYP